MQVQGTYVTYVRNVGFYVQSDPTGPGVFVYTSPNTPAVAVGNKIDLEVTSVTTFNGTKEVNGFNVLTNDGGTYDVVGNLAQTVTANPTATEESELLKANGITITGGASPNYAATIGSPPVPFSYYQYEGTALGLCKGAKLDSIGVGNNSNGVYDFRSYYKTDTSNVDLTGCAVASMDNWNLEDWSKTDPPPGFTKATAAELANYTMTQSTQDHTTGGQYSANLTWTTQNNVDIVADYAYPVTGGQTYSCHGWFLDNDAAGRARLYIIWSDGTNNLSQSPIPPYTVDNASWQELVTQHAAPAGATSMKCAIRLYDVPPPAPNVWPGTATVLFDDLSISTP